MHRTALFSIMFAGLSVAAQDRTAQVPRVAVAPESATAPIRFAPDSQSMTIRAGPFSVHGMEMPAMADMPDMPMDDGAMHDEVLYVAVPSDVYVTGYDILLTDARGDSLSREFLHHAGIALLGRRELLHPAYQRLVAAGKETAPVRLPSSIGAALHRGDSLALYVGLHGPRGLSVEGAFVSFRLHVVPAHRRPRPVAVYPMHFDVNFRGGATTSFDLPPGRSARSAEFVMPLNARLIALGGHVHDYARFVRLSECASGRVLATLRAHRRADGTVSGLERFVFGFRDYGLALVRGVCYRVTAVYDNPTGRIIRDGGMAAIAGPLLIEDARDWPVLDPRDPLLISDRRQF